MHAVSTAVLYGPCVLRYNVPTGWSGRPPRSITNYILANGSISAQLRAGREGQRAIQNVALSVLRLDIAKQAAARRNVVDQIREIRPANVCRQKNAFILKLSVLCFFHCKHLAINRHIRVFIFVATQSPVLARTFVRPV